MASMLSVRNVDENNHIIESDEDNNAYKTSCNFN